MADILNYLADRVGMVSFLVGIILMGLGLVSMKYPPKKINDFYGYRMPSVMKSQERWDFAQKFSALHTLKLGLLLFTLSFLNHFVPIGQGMACIIGLVVMALGFAYSVFVTERAIKKNFPNE